MSIGPDGRSAADAEERPPICPVCGVTMVPAELSADDALAGDWLAGDWVCLECEETGR